jgi:hypothetical protein
VKDYSICYKSYNKTLYAANTTALYAIDAVVAVALGAVLQRV